MGKAPITSLGMDAASCDLWLSTEITWPEMTFEEAQESAKLELAEFQSILPMQVNVGIEWTAANVDGDTIHYAYLIDLGNPFYADQSEAELLAGIASDGRDATIQTLCAIPAVRGQLEAGMLMSMTYETTGGGSENFLIRAEDC